MAVACWVETGGAAFDRENSRRNIRKTDIRLELIGKMNGRRVLGLFWQRQVKSSTQQISSRFTLHYSPFTPAASHLIVSGEFDRFYARNSISPMKLIDPQCPNRHSPKRNPYCTLFYSISPSSCTALFIHPAFLFILHLRVTLVNSVTGDPIFNIPNRFLC